MFHKYAEIAAAYLMINPKKLGLSVKNRKGENMKVLFVLGIVLGFSQIAFAGSPPVNQALLDKGKTVYTMNCVACHGDKGDGNGPAGAVMNPKPRNFITDKFKKGDKPAAVFEVVSKGLKDTTMAAFGHLSEEERWAVSHYLLTFRKGAKK
jgi:mono/diheme cytochrome c family protein